jgi:hypothetical protein
MRCVDSKIVHFDWELSELELESQIVNILKLLQSVVNMLPQLS